MNLVDFLIFLIALPLSVWMLANFLGVLDRRPIAIPLIRLAASLAAIAAFLLVTHRSHLTPIVTAFVIVTLLHLASGWMLRRNLGIPSYSSQTTVLDPPQLDDPADEEETPLEDDTETTEEPEHSGTQARGEGI